MRILNAIAFVLTIIGGINWLCIGLFQFDFVAAIFGSQAMIGSRIIYALVGISALYLIYLAIANKGKMDVCAKSND